MANAQRIRSSNGAFISGTAALLALVCASGCERDNVRPSVPDGGWKAREGGVLFDGRPDIGASPDGLPQDAQGPQIEILAPEAGATVVEGVLKVRARITDDDGVDPSTITVTVQGHASTAMKLGGEPNTYEASIDVGELSGDLRLWIIAADLLGHENSAVREFRRDPGPTVEFLAPDEGGRHKGSLKVEVLVRDPVGIARFELSLSGDALKTSKKDLADDSALYTATIDFDDPYDPPLAGEQVLTATAENESGAVTVVKRTFFIDVEGPEIVVSQPVPGQIVGGLLKLQARITDPAGVLPSSVHCVVGNEFKNRLVQLVQSPTDADVYIGELDTRELEQTDLWPVVSFRATDELGNEQHHDFQVGLDNGPPIVALDPPAKFFMAKYEAGVLWCSHPFDPVGADAANDVELVPQVVPIRARIEDQGNPTISAKFVPLALVDKTKVHIYVLDDTSKALVVDTDGDGYCDSINPNVVPKGSQPQAGEAVADQLAPVPPAGEANYTPWYNPLAGKNFPLSVCNDGMEDEPPDPFCGVSPELTRVIFYAGIEDEPAIYAIPPVVEDSKVQCLGLPFDFGANEIENGWVCVAGEAVDGVGNTGISKPLRLWLNKAAVLSQKGTSPPGGAGVPPHCSGTLDPATGNVNPTKPCKFRGVDEDFSQVFSGTLVRTE